jgi:hypothetical protein
MKYEGSEKIRQRADLSGFRTDAPSVASSPIGSFSEELRKISAAPAMTHRLRMQATWGAP